MFNAVEDGLNQCSDRTVRTVPRHEDCATFEDEKKTYKLNFSNFVSHCSSVCKTIPPKNSFDEWEKAHILGTKACTEDAPAHAQRQVLRQFIDRGIANPGKELTMKGFREYYVKGIIEDDLPFTFGKKKGMSRCFLYVLPAGYTIPSPSTVTRDASRLHGALNKIVTTMIEV